MKKAIIILLSAALVLMAVSCASNSGAAKSESVPVKGTSHGYAYTATTDGNNLTFVIEGNPTTGYQWQLTTEDESVKASSEYGEKASPEGMVGVGGNYKFDITFLKDGDFTLKFTYLRSWAPDDNPVDLTMKVEVEKGQITGVMVETVE
ncbi:MAG: protease inhibitor I42 family protein [bacterium]|nr:protease inhibitor I42 family protein [bacterium]